MSQDSVDEAEFFSKSQRKREMHALQEVGQQMLALNPQQQAQLPISDDMRAALAEARRIHSNEAQRRHLQYIGKLMRAEDIEQIQRTLQAFDPTSRLHQQHFHQLEQWRDRLLTETEQAFEQWLALHPQTDRQTLRQLIRNAHKEADQGKPPTSARKLFRYLRELSPVI